MATSLAVYSPFFSKFGHSLDTPGYNLKTARDYGMNFLETLARSGKAHFCLKFSKNKVKLRKFNPVVTVRDVISIFYTIPKIPVRYGVWNKI